MAPDRAFKYRYEWRDTDGSSKASFDFIAFFWENAHQSREQAPENTLQGLLILYIRDEHGHEYELSDFPETVQDAMKRALLQYLSVERFVL